MGCHFLLQRVFLTQKLNPGLPPCRQTLYWLSHQRILSSVKKTEVTEFTNYAQITLVIIGWTWVQMYMIPNPMLRACFSFCHIARRLYFLILFQSAFTWIISLDHHGSSVLAVSSCLSFLFFYFIDLERKSTKNYLYTRAQQTLSVKYQIVNILNICWPYHLDYNVSPLPR